MTTHSHRVLIVAGLLLVGGGAVLIPWAYGLLGTLLTSLVFYFLLVVLGLCFGAVMGVLFVDLERLDKTHHLALLIAIPVVLFACAQWFLSLGLAGTQLFSHNALIGGLVYATSFTITYAYVVIKEWNLLTTQ